MELPYDPAILLLGISIKETKAGTSKKIFIALSAVAKDRSNHMPIEGWVDKQNVAHYI